MQFYSRTKRQPSINIVSLIDILCILLIFFIVTTTFKKIEPELEITLPGSTEATKEERTNEPLIIYVDKKETIYVGKDKVSIDDLADFLKKKKAEIKNPYFALKGDTEIPLGLFVKITDAAKKADIENLSLFTTEEKSP